MQQSGKEHRRLRSLSLKERRERLHDLLIALWGIFQQQAAEQRQFGRTAAGREPCQ